MAGDFFDSHPIFKIVTSPSTLGFSALSRSTAFFLPSGVMRLACTTGMACIRISNVFWATREQLGERAASQVSAWSENCLRSWKSWRYTPKFPEEFTAVLSTPVCSAMLKLIRSLTPPGLVSRRVAVRDLNLQLQRIANSGHCTRARRSQRLGSEFLVEDASDHVFHGREALPSAEVV